MNDYEDRLIERLDARRAIATLPPRQRRILHHLCQDGKNFTEIAPEIGVSHARVAQLYHTAIKCLRGQLNRQPAVLPRRRDIAEPPAPGFDQAAFLKHMRRITALRRERREAEFERDYAEIQGLVAKEAKKKQPAPEYVPPYEPYVLPSHYTVKPPLKWSINELTFIANMAAECLLHIMQPTRPGNPALGAKITHATFHHAEPVDGAMRGIVAAVPPDARLSACLFPTTWPGVSVSNGCACVHVMTSADGHFLQLGVSWDDPF